MSRQSIVRRGCTHATARIAHQSRSRGITKTVKCRPFATRPNARTAVDTREPGAYPLTADPPDSAPRALRAATHEGMSSSFARLDARAVPAPCGCHIPPRAGASQSSPATCAARPECADFHPRVVGTDVRSRRWSTPPASGCDPTSSRRVRQQSNRRHLHLGIAGRRRGRLSSRSPSGRAGGRSMLAQCLRVAAARPARHAWRCRKSLNNAPLKE